MPVGLAQSFSILREFRPDVVLSFGGYISVPVVVAASTLRIPTVIHEQTFGVGLANKIAANFADKVCISWDSSKRFFPVDKVVLSGNPLRNELLEQESSQNVTSRSQKVSENLPLLFVTGGSGGAHAINSLIEGCLQRLLQQYHVIHQTGDAREFGDFDRLQRLKVSLPEELQRRYEVVKFVSAAEVAEILPQADLVIARSGIGTVTELLYYGTPALFIPLPFGQHNEQLTNAKFVQHIGLAEIAEQKTVTPDSFYTLVTKMLHNKEAYKKHADTARQLVVTDAAQTIIGVITDVYKEKKTTKSY